MAFPCETNTFLSKPHLAWIFFLQKHHFKHLHQKTYQSLSADAFHFGPFLWKSTISNIYIIRHISHYLQTKFLVLSLVNNYFHLRVGSSVCACAIYIQWRKVCKVLLWTPRWVSKNPHTHRKPKHSTILYFLNQVRWEITFPNDFTSHYTGACSGKKKCSGIKRV